MDKLDKEIGNRVKYLRKAHHFTQEQLAEKLNVTSKHISSIERGVSSLSVEKMIEISRMFDCTLDYLITGKNKSDYLGNFPELHDILFSVLTQVDEKEYAVLVDYMKLYTKMRT